MEENLKKSTQTGSELNKSHSLRMLVTGMTPYSITVTQRPKMVMARVGSLAPSTFPTETKLYTTTESPSGEPFAIDQRYFRDTVRVDNPTFGGSR